MRKILMTTAAILALAAPAWAGPVPAFCTGTVTTVSNGSNLPGSFFLSGGASTGNCAEAADKYIGGFSTSGAITGAGSSVFTFSMPTGPANVQIGIQGSIGGTAAATGGIVYSVQVDPALSNGALITALGKDFTLGAANVTGSATATLTGSTTASTFAYDCTRTVNPQSSTCPQDAVFSPVNEMTVTENLATGANAVVTGLTDTISQSVPEPRSLAMLGTGLLIMGLAARRRRRP